jgi:hypothetical protein
MGNVQNVYRVAITDDISIWLIGIITADILLIIKSNFLFTYPIKDVSIKSSFLVKVCVRSSVLKTFRTN